MTVYVDNARLAFRGMLMAHLVADSLPELHDMARRIGLKRSWFQRGSVLEHYDVSLSKRRLAIECGAVPINVEQLHALIRARREKTSRREAMGRRRAPAGAAP